MSIHGSGGRESGKGRPGISEIGSVIGAIAMKEGIVEIEGKQVEGGIPTGGRSVNIG